MGRTFWRQAVAALVVTVGLSDCDHDAEVAAPDSGRHCRLIVDHLPKGFPAYVGVAGSFNGYDADNSPLLPSPDGVWRGAFEVSPGLVLYRLEIDGRPRIDSDNPLTVQREGEIYSAFYADDCTRPAVKARSVDVELSADGRSGRVTVALEHLSAEPDPSSLAAVRALIDGDPADVRASTDGEIVISRSGLPLGKHRLELMVEDQAGRSSAVFNAPFWVEPTPFQWEDAIIYQIVTDRFAADEPFSPQQRSTPKGRRVGGNLRGLLRIIRSGYFEQLGVNTLWFSPLNRNPEGLFVGVEGGVPRYEGYHGYWPAAAREVDPKLGTSEDVEAVVAEAHGRGMRVLMDVVLNHVHDVHPYFATHPDWFDDPPCVCGMPACPWSSHIESCWFTAYLPDIAWRSAEVLETQIDDALWWVERFDLDGLRVDAVPMMPRFVSRHLTALLHRRFEGLFVRHYLLGETFTGASDYDMIRWYLGPDGLDGQFDFPLMWALRSAFAWRQGPLWALDDAFAESQDAWRNSTAVMGMMVGNHDVTRFISEAAGQIDRTVAGQPWRAPPGVPEEIEAYDGLLLAQSFVLTAPGAPIIYYGDEFGMPGADDPDNRRPMRFDDELSAHEAALQRKIARLGRLRRCLVSLRRGDFFSLRVSQDRYTYLRDAEDGAPAFVVLNRADSSAQVEVPIPPWLEVTDEAFVEAMTGRVIARQGATFGPLTVAPRSPAVLIPKTSPCASTALDSRSSP